MKTIEFEIKTSAVLMVHSFGSSPCDASSEPTGDRSPMENK